VKFAASNGLMGMEKLAGIPGSVGGAVYGNAGAYGESTSDTLVRVKVFDGEKICWVDKNKGQFAYRDSIFKKTKPVILEAEFKLKEVGKKVSEGETNKAIEERIKKYSGPLACPGSFFKNVLVSDVSKEALTQIPKNKITFDKIPAGYLLESVGAMGMKKGKIEVSSFHANFIINTGGGTASDYYSLVMDLRQKIKEKYGIILEPEVQMIGFSKKAAVLGLGLEGKDLVKYLLGQNFEVTIFDKKEEKELDLGDIDKSKIKLITGENYLKNGLTGFDVIFRSPGVYRYIPELVEAEKAGVEISSAIKTFFSNCPGKIIGVTGTKGKGTTSSLIYEILKDSGKDVYLAGNIGKPYLELLNSLTKDSYVVLELSSFQLIDLTVSPHIAVVLNITQDHLDWHKDLKEYIEAKTNIVKHQKEDDFAVINTDYEIPLSFANKTKAKVLFFSRKKEVEGSYVEEGKIILNTKDKVILGETKDLLLRGEHNWENITAAVCASFAAGADILSIKKVIFSFKGLEHRLELVGEYGGVNFYNDSFATGPQPTMAAIDSFKEPTTLILGGYDKGLDFSELGKQIAETKNLTNVILIGNLEDKLEKLIKRENYSGQIIRMDKSPMEEIVKKAYSVTPKGGVVLLSPAAASFDMFLNYKDRGNKFKEAVRSASFK
jgi:UDP-N-acetylmuramoylalanine--D-glutamate ligase